MAVQVVDDRYVRQDQDRWLDVATAHVVRQPDHAPCRCHRDDDRGDVARTVERILRAAELRDASGIQTIRLPARPGAVCVVSGQAARLLRPLGFVTVCAGADLPEAARREVLHRHVALFGGPDEWGGAGRDRLTEWIRALAAASPRAHLFVLLAADARPGESWGGASAVRERAVEMEMGRDWPSSRAREWRRRYGRVAHRAGRLIRAGALHLAESLVQSLLAESAVRGEPVPAPVLVRQVELRFWQGRIEEAVAVTAGASGREAAFWRRMTRWATGVAASASWCDAWPSAVDYLHAALDAQDRLEAGAPVAARAIIARRTASAAPLPLLETALLGRIDAGCRGEPPDCLRETEAFIRRTGAHGLRLWGLGRTTMNLLHGVSALFALVQDAEDENAALRQGCSWVRDQARADGAGIIVEDGTRLVAGEGVAQADLTDPDVREALGGSRGRVISEGARAMVTEPVRYGGVTIGVALVRGRPEAADGLRGAAKALASVCAPALRARLDALALAAASRTLVPEILGRSPAIAALREATARAAATPFPVLIEGESGTGKELVARAVHRLSARRDRRFAALNCAALTDELVEAELFGHARGAFTGAINHRAGLFEETHGSTLFLDEIAELSPRAQAKLLRVLQEREIRRVGEHVARPVDVRVVAATNLPLSQAVGAGRFREDLLFRLAVVRIRVPALRDRIEDVPLLAQAFWRAVSVETGKQAQLGADAVAGLCRYAWPGNVRELQNVVSALVVAAPTRGRVGARLVEQVLAGPPGPEAPLGPTLGRARAALERRMIAAALARHGGRCARAARELGLSRQGLAKAIKRLRLDPEMPEPSVAARPPRALRAGATCRRIVAAGVEARR